MIPAVHAWPTNGHLLADVARLYIDPEDLVLDVTYGEGTWWRVYRPLRLIGSELDPSKAPDLVADLRALPFPEASVDVLAFDPPYKLNGTPTLAVDHRYGVDVPARWQDRHALIRAGITEAARVLRSRGRLLLKCQDQVCSGKVRWQTIDFTHHAAETGLDLVDRFDLVGHHRAQPMSGRRQRHAHGRPSTLLVFEASP